MKALIFLSIIILISSCNSSKNKGASENVPFDSIAHGYYSSIDTKKQVVLNNDGDYRKIWDEVYKDLDQIPRIPDVDFKVSTVIAVFMGTKTSGGFDVKISKITSADSKLIVDVTEISPGVNCMTTDVITKPFEFVKIKKTDKEAEFRISSITKDCK